ncbi:MAG: TIR domain-containing protein [Limisphaerales bacterium]
MSAEVFVSYSSQDHAQVSKIIERLRKAGVSVWMDEGGIDAASLWSEAIVEAINDCEVLIMMVSRHSTDSANVVKEVMLASESSKTILPVYLEPADIPMRLKYQLTGIQHSEAFSLSLEDLTDELLRGLSKNGVNVPGYESAPLSKPNSSTHKRKRGQKAQWKTPALVGLILFTIGLLIGIQSRNDSVSIQTPEVTADHATRLAISIPDDLKILAGGDNPYPWAFGSSVEISPNGRYVAYYTITNSIHSLRLIDLSNYDEGKKLLEGEALEGMIFSRDSKWIAYFDNGKIKKTLVETGEISIVGETRIPNYGYWGDDGYIYYVHSLGRKLSRIKDVGGKAELLHEGPHQEGATLGKPFVLSGGRGVIMAFPGKGINRNYAPIKHLDLKNKKIKDLGVSGIWPYYHESGYLLFARNGNIWATPFDLGSLRVKADPVPIIKGVCMFAHWERAQYSISDSGTLVYLEGRDESLGVPAWVNSEGEIEMSSMPEQFYGVSDISPDGKKIAIQIAAEKDDIWIYDTETWEGNKLTVEGSNGWPLWSLDGEKVVFASRSLEEEAWGLYSKKINEIGSPQMIWKPSKGVMATSWHPNEDMLAMNFQSDIWFIKNPLTEPNGNKFTGEKHLEWVGVFSPNGNWISYDDDQTGTYRTVVRSLTNTNQIHQVNRKESDNGIWSPNGEALYFFQGEGRLFKREFNPESSKDPVGKIEEIFSIKWIDNPGSSYDVHPEEEKFLLIVPKTPFKKIREIRVLLNIQNELNSLFKK